MQTLATALIELNESKPPNHREWKARRTGLVALEKDYVLKVYVFRLYENGVSTLLLFFVCSISLAIV